MPFRAAERLSILNGGRHDKWMDEYYRKYEEVEGVCRLVVLIYQYAVL
jgi:5-methylcytosine-specific restriction endonuclease McrBC regulatory subunit McrC